MQDLLQVLRKMKEQKSYEAISRLFGFSVRTVIRWINGECKISQASEYVLRSKIRKIMSQAQEK